MFLIRLELAHARAVLSLRGGTYGREAVALVVVCRPLSSMCRHLRQTRAAWRVGRSGIALLILCAAGATTAIVLREYDGSEERRGSPQWVLGMLLVITFLALRYFR
jgi:hypothetical protein